MNLDDLEEPHARPAEALHGRQPRRRRRRSANLTESVDNLAKAKEILEAKGMKVNAADVASFRKLAEDKIWPGYKQQYGELWDRVVSAK